MPDNEMNPDYPNDGSDGQNTKGKAKMDAKHTAPAKSAEVPADAGDKYPAGASAPVPAGPVMSTPTGTPGIDVDANTAAARGAFNTEQMIREATEGSGDPIRDAKLLKEHGSVYDPATSPHDTAAVSSEANPDRIVSPRTQEEMAAGKDALNKRNASVVERGGPVVSPNVNVPRENTPENFNNRTGKPFTR